ncbi:MAG: peptidylprolyl isomerase [Nevskiales bacterium]|nr:peptidylprolyl isomerase [Nevskiales bacterium]
MTASHAAAPIQLQMETNLGVITLELNTEKAPKTTENFMRYVKDRHYNGLVFHRVIKGFMIQGGGYDETLKQRPVRAPVSNEARNGLSNLRGTLAMARTSDPHSATSQFFINLVDNLSLDATRAADTWGYTVFGKVISGMDVVDKIGASATGARRPFGSDVPINTVVIKSMAVLEPSQTPP